MRVAILGFCLLPIAVLADTTLWQGQSDRTNRWFATNQDGYCSLKHSAGAADARVDFLFSSLSEADHQPIFQVIRTPRDLVWPVRVQLGSDWNAPQFEIGGESSSAVLLGAQAQTLLHHLKTGGWLHFVYSLTDGVERRVTLGQAGFPQSLAMFDICIAHVA
jgi:hypothetical protein